MSGSDDTESQCDRTSETNGAAMGDVLAKEQNDDNDTNEDSIESDDEPVSQDQRQEADGAPDALDVVPEFNFLFDPVQMDATENPSNTSDEHRLNDKTMFGKKPIVRHQENCTCETCTVQRAFLKEKMETIWRWQAQGLKLREYIRAVFNAAIEAPYVPNIPKYQCDPDEYAQLQEIVEELSRDHPHKLFLMLVVQAQEFVVELKIRIMDPLQDNSLARIAEVFLTRLLNGYDILISTAVQVSELIKPLEERHLSKFNLTWEFFNKKLYQNYIYFYEPTIRNILPSVVGQLRKPRKGKGFQVLLERYLAFVDEMMRIAGLWPEKEHLIDKYSAEQVAQIMKNRKIGKRDWTLCTVSEIQQADKSRTIDVPGVGLQESSRGAFLDKKLEVIEKTMVIDTVRSMLDAWGKQVYQTMAQGYLGVYTLSLDGEDDDRFEGRPIDDPGFYFGYQVAAWLVLSRPTDNASEAETECSTCDESSWVSHLVAGGRTKNGTCAHPVLQPNGKINTVIEDEQILSNEEKRRGCICIYRHLGEWQGSSWRGLLPFPPCLCMLYMRHLPETACPCLRDSRVRSARKKSKSESASYSSSPKEVQDLQKAPSIKLNSTQTQTRHSTTQTPNPPHNHQHQGHQGRCPTHGHSHGSPSDSNKSLASSHRSHSYNNHNNHSCHKQMDVEHIKRVTSSELNQNDGDLSDSGSSHEDSCSTSSSTPRDSSRHCDCCYCEVFGHGIPSVAPVSRNYNEMRERLRQLLTKKKAKKCKATCSPPMSPAESVPSFNATSDHNSASINSGGRSNTPVSIASTNLPEQRDQRDLDELLEFIEGNQSGKAKRDSKKSEKKARQKQKKLDEALKKENEERERQKLIELQKKTPEVTITVVDPQKPVPQKLLNNRNLPEVSILLTVIPQPQKQQSNKKNSKQDNSKVKPLNSIPQTVSASETTVKSKQNIKSSENSQKSKEKSKGKKKPPPTPTPEPEPEPELEPEPEVPLTKKERKKLRREMRKIEEEKAKQQESQVEQPQIVTIKRVMESNSAEPTVTITLKGQTPAEDKVLFTLVNGQTKEPAKDEPQTSGKKKKKNKGDNSNNSSNQPKQQQQVKVQQTSTKSQAVKNDTKSTKQQQLNEKSKNTCKQPEEKKLQQQNIETSSKKSKKNKKDAENKQPVVQQPSNTSNQQIKSKNQQQESIGKKKNKSQPLVESKIQQNAVNTAPVSATSGKKKSQQQEKNNQQQPPAKSKNVNPISNKQAAKSDNQRNQAKSNQPSVKPKANIDNRSGGTSSPLGSQLKDASSKINIENLKLPPGITITKVDAPAKPLPIKSSSVQKPPVQKQATIIAAPMGGLQSNYGGSQSGGNVIVVDTGKLKQDLLPKNSEKESSNQPMQNGTSGKKKKKKNSSSVTNSSQKSAQEAPKDGNDEKAKILHNPGTNMVTIRNPAFGPAPKVEPTQQAAIIKVSENGMVTIRSPALQQAINAGLTPPPKPNFIVKGDLTTASANKNNTLSSTNTIGSNKSANGLLPSSLAELRSRLTPDCTGIQGLANIQISKVTNGQPIPENGINLKGTSVTLTKVKTTTTTTTTTQDAVKIDDVQQNNHQGATSSGKGKKKKKKGNGTRQCGDDWNLVESVFTPKDIEDGEMDDAERELEAFKRFCLQSVPPPRKEKVNLNLKDIVLKKKSSSSAAAAVIAAN